MQGIVPYIRLNTFHRGMKGFENRMKCYLLKPYSLRFWFKFFDKETEQKFGNLLDFQVLPYLSHKICFTALTFSY